MDHKSGMDRKTSAAHCMSSKERTNHTQLHTRSDESATNQPKALAVRHQPVESGREFRIAQLEPVVARRALESVECARAAVRMSNEESRRRLLEAMDEE
jgi:hypothetical protein